MASSQAEPKPGDLIEIFRHECTHWALYVGDGYVVHLAPPGDIAGAALDKLMSSGSGRAIVKKERLYKVAGKDMYRINNKHDRKHKPLDPREIVRRAEELVGQEMPYKLTSDNCEDFVKELRSGVSRSDQLCSIYPQCLQLLGSLFKFPRENLIGSAYRILAQPPDWLLLGQREPGSEASMDPPGTRMEADIPPGDLSRALLGSKYKSSSSFFNLLKPELRPRLVSVHPGDRGPPASSCREGAAQGRGRPRSPVRV